MNTTQEFQRTIKAHLDNLAGFDDNFAQKYAKENKSIEECCNYIANEIFKTAKSGNIKGVTDDEVFGLAVHYYEEDDLNNIKPPQYLAVVNHSVELTEGDRAKAKADAIEALKQEEIRKLKEKEKKEKERVEKKRQEALKKEEEMPSLF